MTETEYNSRRDVLLSRINIAINAHCKRTALARIRELSKLTQQYNGSPYQEIYNKLVAYYEL